MILTPYIKITYIKNNFSLHYVLLERVLILKLNMSIPKKNFMRFLKYFLFFIAFALAFSVIKISVFENEVNTLFILETFVASSIATIVIYFFNNYSKN